MATACQRNVSLSYAPFALLTTPSGAAAARGGGQRKGGGRTAAHRAQPSFLPSRHFLPCVRACRAHTTAAPRRARARQHHPLSFMVYARFAGLPRFAQRRALLRTCIVPAVRALGGPSSSGRRANDVVWRQSSSQNIAGLSAQAPRRGGGERGNSVVCGGGRRRRKKERRRTLLKNMARTRAANALTGEHGAFTNYGEDNGG